MAKHFDLNITDDRFTFARNTAKIDAETSASKCSQSGHPRIRNSLGRSMVRALDGGQLRIRLPDGRLSGIVSVLGPQQQDGTRRVIFMPSAATFSARTTRGDRQQYEIQRLNDARSDSEGNVELANGQFLHGIDLIPAPAHYDFTLQREGLLEHQCYRSVDGKLLPGLKVLDYAQVAKIQIKRLKPVVRFIMELKLPDVTETFIGATLKRAGVQLPRSGARK
jgi:hypothetical protein